MDGWIATLFRLNSYPRETYWLMAATVKSPVGFSSSARSGATKTVRTVNMVKTGMHIFLKCPFLFIAFSPSVNSSVFVFAARRFILYPLVYPSPVL